jgi:hypothetical protein
MGFIAKKNDIFKTNSPERLGSLAYNRFSPFFFWPRTIIEIFFPCPKTGRNYSGAKFNFPINFLQNELYILT